MQRQIDPAELVAVIHTGNLEPRRYYVRRADYDSECCYLNTYLRGGKLRMQRRATVPISREFLAGLAEGAR